MNTKKLKKFFMIILFGLSIWVFSNSSQAAYVSVKPSTTSASPGQTVTLTVSSDCVGRVNLSVSNGSLSANKVWVEGGSATASITIGNSGTATVTATPENGAMSNGGVDVPVSATSASISIKTASNNTNNTSNPKTTTNPEPQKKSSNANLSNLGIRPNDFSGFKAGTTTYNVTVPKNVEEVEVYAKAQDSKAKVAGTGKKKLQEGKNTASVTVTAEDGTKKTYTINITRSATEENDEDEETDDPEADDNNETDTTEAKGLSELKIGNLELSPTFRTDIYEYTAKYIGEDTKLEVSTITTEDDYTIEVTGNEDLKEGENIITILVSDAEGNNVATYQVTVNKSLAQETLPENQDENGMKILGIVVGVVIVLIIIFLIVRHRRNKKWEEEYSTPFSTLNDDDNIYKNQLEDFDENMKPTKRKENRDSRQDKKAAKEEYLNNFNSNNDEYPEWQEEKVRKRRTKGKRFK